MEKTQSFFRKFMLLHSMEDAAHSNDLSREFGDVLDSGTFRHIVFFLYFVNKNTQMKVYEIFAPFAVRIPLGSK